MQPRNSVVDQGSVPDQGSGGSRGRNGRVDPWTSEAPTERQAAVTPNKHSPLTSTEIWAYALRLLS
jgi:hypothetical protein